MYFDCCGYWDVAGLSLFLGALLLIGIIYVRWLLKQRYERAYDAWCVEVAEYNMDIAREQAYSDPSNWFTLPDGTRVYEEPEFYIDDHWGQ